jgi:hypothetical protein
VLRASEEVLREQIMDVVMVVLDLSQRQALTRSAMEVIRRVAAEFTRREELGQVRRE